jgi:hypothetical protein
MFLDLFLLLTLARLFHILRLRQTGGKFLPGLMCLLEIHMGDTMLNDTFSQRNKRKYKGIGRGKQGVECWNVGVLGCWGVGVLEYVGMMEHCFCFKSEHVMY